MISDNTSLAVDDTVQLLPSGTLILHLKESTYKTLGIPGTPSKQFNTKHVVSIQLLSKSMRSGRNEHERVRTCFADCPDLVFNFMLSWKPKDSAICSSSVGNYFTRESVICFPSAHTLRRLRWKQAPVPFLGDDSVDRSDVFEWIGDVACEAELGRSCENGFEYECPEPSLILKHLSYHSVSGLITQEDIHELISKLREYVKETEDVPWVTLTVDGHKEAPVLYKLFENSSAFCRDHVYSLILFKSGETWVDQCIRHGEKCL